jgi:hypothetical protein
MSHSSQLTNGPPPISSAMAFSSRSTTNFESNKSQAISTGQTTGPSRLLTSSIGGVGDRLQSFSCPPSGSFQPNTRPLVAVSPPLTTSPAEGRPLQPKYLVSLIGISPSHDILSFPFITSLGRVLESNISPLVSSAGSSENSSTSSSTNTSPTPSNCSTKEPAINYVIAPKTSSQYAQLHSLNNAILPIDDCHITVREFSLPLAISLIQSTVGSNSMSGLVFTTLGVSKNFLYCLQLTLSSPNETSFTKPTETSQLIR